MNIKQVKHELQNILSGKSNYSYDAPIQTVANFIRASKKTSSLVEREQPNKSKETKELIAFAKENEQLYSVVKQPFVKADSLTDLKNVKLF